MKYYVDFVNGDDANDGLATITAWQTFKKGFESLAAGDELVVRRNMSQAFTAPVTHGYEYVSVKNPYLVHSDYNDEFGDFTNITQTATTTYGAKTIDFSGDISGEINAGDWIYVQGDDNTEFAYEVKNVNVNQVELWLPFKGTAGSGLAMVNMKANPIVNGSYASYSVSFGGSNVAIIRGLHFRGAKSNKILGVSAQTLISDCIFESNQGTYDTGYGIQNSSSMVIDVRKTRFYNIKYAIDFGSSKTASTQHVTDCFFDGNDINSSFQLYNKALVKVKNCEFINLKYIANYWTVVGEFFNNSVQTTYSRNFDVDSFGRLSVENDNKIIGNSYVMSNNATPIIKSVTDVLRPEGATTSLLVSPHSKVANTLGNLTALTIFELPVYVDTTQTTFKVYFASKDTTQWDANPTANELYLEVEFYATNTETKIVRSTETIDFKTDTNFDKFLSVTFTQSTPAIVKLRLIYKKALESGKTNQFYVDPLPVMTQA